MSKDSSPSCDYLIIGGGSAGAVLAARLTEDPKISVTLVEAGPEAKGFWVSTPLGVAKIVLGNAFLWQFFTKEQEAMKGQKIYWPRGKALGGSSTVNGMIWTRGDREAYDHIASLGCPGFDWDTFAPYLNKTESYEGAPSQARGAVGPITASRIDAQDDLTRAFIKASEEIGYPHNEDFNDGDQSGVAHLQYSIRDGKRCSTHVGYLKPAMGRQNLRVLTGVAAERILLDGRRAVGAYVKTEQGVELLRAGREVILCAGALKTPQILEMSGLGQAERLGSLGIDVVQDMPEVGENLIDHVNIRMTYKARKPITLNDVMASKVKTLLEGMKYVFLKKGFLTYPTVTSQAIKQLHSGDRYSTAKLQIGLISGPDRYANTADNGLDSWSGFNIGTFQLYPKSRGYVHATSADPHADPEMTANYFADEYDRALAVAQFREVRKLAAASPLSREIIEENRPGPAMSDDDALLNYALETGQTCWHPVGSARMGEDDRAVVGTDLKVKKVASLRIVDASVWPDIPASNTNAPTIALAEKAADMIKEAH
ncbi:MAG: GMC family oxidoreductase N-terminal domain-containing protein [Pseudomonadota bacterium]